MQDKPNPLVDRANHVISPVLGHYTTLEVVRGEGCYLIGKDEKRYLDFSSGIGVCATGHCHPTVVEAIQKQAQTLIHGCIGVVYYAQPIELAEKIGKLLGHNLTNLFFTQSGSEAIESALKLAKYVTKKHKIVAFRGGFHGRTLGALSITTSKDSYQDGYAPLLEGVTYFPYPYCYHCPFGLERKTCEVGCISKLESFFEGLDDQVAAVVIEPILGEGGYTEAPAEFLKALEKHCRDRKILLIMDEIQTGFGKTGSWFAFQKAGITPDIVTLAKGMGSGLPIGACASTPELMSQWKTGAHGGTYGGNPVTCAASLATIAVLEDALPKISSLAKTAENLLNNTLASHPNVGDIRYMGLMIGIEIVKSKKDKTPDPDLKKKIMSACLDQNLIVIGCGIHDNVIRLIPPLIIDEETLVKGLEILVKCINETH